MEPVVGHEHVDEARPRRPRSSRRTARAACVARSPGRPRGAAVPTLPASARATFVAKSPCSFCRGASSSGSGSSPSRPRSLATASIAGRDRSRRSSSITSAPRRPRRPRLRRRLGRAPGSGRAARGRSDRTASSPAGRHRGRSRQAPIVVARRRRQEDEPIAGEPGVGADRASPPRTRRDPASSRRAPSRRAALARPRERFFPCEAVLTSNPSSRKFTSSRRTITGSSSTRSTCGATPRAYPRPLRRPLRAGAPRPVATLSGATAPVAQGIEHRPPEPVAQVRILPGAPSRVRSAEGGDAPPPSRCAAPTATCPADGMRSTSSSPRRSPPV